jgi:hypothetical protein
MYDKYVNTDCNININIKPNFFHLILILITSLQCLNVKETTYKRHIKPIRYPDNFPALFEPILTLSNFVLRTLDIPENIGQRYFYVRTWLHKCSDNAMGPY